MSTPATEIRQRLSPWIDAAAAQRARLSLVPSARRSSPRLPFIALLTVMLVGGVVGLLCFNTQMQQAAFTETSLQRQADALAEQQQTLTLQLQQMSDPQELAARAAKLGLVIPAAPAMIRVKDGSVIGTPTPAQAAGGSTPRLWAPVTKPDFAARR